MPVETFVRALDLEEFARAQACLAADCVYEFRGRRLVSPPAIIASYRRAARWASASFDRIRYESAITVEAPGRYRVRFVDLTDHAGRSHRHECEQVLRTDRDGLIIGIEHIDLPGERERLADFLARVGVAPMG